MKFFKKCILASSIFIIALVLSASALAETGTFNKAAVNLRSKPREPLNNKPCILVKHAIQAFFQNTGLIFTQICLFSLISCFLFCKRADFPLDLCCGKFSTGNRQRIQIGTGKQGI